MKRLIVLSTLAAANVLAQTPIAHWRFEKDLQPAPRSASVDVPGPYIYDPLAKDSRVNRGCAAFSGKTDGMEIPLDLSKYAGQSLTFEAFVMPGMNKESTLVLKSRKAETAAELGFGLVFLPNSNQTWHGGLLSAVGAQPKNWPVGHYSSTTRLSREVQEWRHIAMVYDAQAKTATCYVDYHLSRAETVNTPLQWDEGAVHLGKNFIGLIDEIRFTPAALGPHQFLRARSDSLSGVSFASTQQIAPRDAGCLDVKEHFGAAGDGKTDDTAAFNAAFRHLTSKVPLAYNTLLIPAGTYLVRDTLYCSRFIDVKGSGPEKTIIRLKDSTFTDANSPKPVLRMSSTPGEPGSNRAVNGSSISIYLDGVTIDTGSNNPGAKALEYHSNNLGRLENVILRSGDGQGAVGLDLTHKTNGPALIRAANIIGFDYAITSKHQEYSLTLEHVAMRGQKKAGIFNQGNILALRGIVSDNAVPAVISEGANSMITLLDSTLKGGSAEQPAIRAEGGLYCRNVRTVGYKAAIEKSVLVDSKTRETKVETIPGPGLVEFIGDQLTVGHGKLTGSLKLPIEETPRGSNVPISEWVSVAKFSDKITEGDWSPAVQAAISSGARVIYFPANLPMTFRTPIHLRGNVERLIGYGRRLSWAPDVWKGDDRREQTDTAKAPPPLLIFDDDNASRLVILDRLDCQHIQHASRGTLVLRSSSPGRYTTTVPGGKLFAEDVGGPDWHFDHAQSAWFRQWNPESHAAGPCVHSRGATIWALGFKTEYESQKLLAELGAQTEILGAFIYPIGSIPATRPIFENRNSAISLVYGTSVYGSNHKVHIRDVGADTREFTNDHIKWAGSRGRMDLYTSDAR